MPLLPTLNDLKHVINTALKNYESIGIITHVHPDGDGFCAALALQEYLRNRGLESDIVLEEDISEQYDFLQGRKRSITYHRHLTYDLIFILDTHEARRVGACAALLDPAREIIVIDHHELAEEITGSHMYINTSTVSAGAILFDLFHDEILALPKEPALYVASCIYTTILNDTDNFINANVTTEVFTIASHLMDLGINPGYIVEKFFNNRRPDEMRFIGEVLSTIETIDNDAVLFIDSTIDMMERNNVTDEATSKMTRWVKGLKNVKVIVYFREAAENSYRLSLRSNVINVNTIAVKHGGGGHIKASGCSMTGTLNTIKNQILADIRKQLA
ncbi:MAG: bifunctional oligoribonuclease/PAP phosphatase NrnA [Candidatus Cloacimonetes bacterium]|nr:bifunctional oligoribonuclease/PAP phosphatase NrnA [Candidatus Cloacimonadota bacterium]